MARKLTEWFSRVWRWRITRTDEISVNVNEEENITRALGRYEPYVISIQKLLIWENPFMSVLCVVLVNILFWFAVNFQCRFYGVVFCAILFAFLYDMWIERIWPEISVPVQQHRQTAEKWSTAHPSVLSVPEISHYISKTQMFLKEYYIWLKNLRDDQPGMFCCTMSACFIVLTLIGRAVPGSVIAYVVVMVIMVGPGICIHLIPPSLVQKLRCVTVMFKPKHKDTDSEVEDYLPDPTGENLALLQLAGEPLEVERDDEPSIIGTDDLCLDAEETGDSSNTQTSFTTGVSVMPSHDEGSTDGMDVSEFELAAPSPPVEQQKKTVSRHHNVRQALDPDISDSDVEEEAAGIHFQSSHFNGDSSEDEEGDFTRGLAFDNAREATEPTTASTDNSSLGEMLSSTVMSAVTKNISSLGAMGQSLFSTMISAGSTQKPKKRAAQGNEHLFSDDSEEDFEMISQDDLS